MHPRTFENQTWFIQAKAVVAAYQARKVMEEQKVWEQERQPYMEALKDTLAKLQAANTSLMDLLTYIYANHPPKKEGQAMKAGQEHTILKHAILHYHPDKQNKEEHGREWFVLCEEISKLLTNRFNHLKGVWAAVWEPVN